MANHAATRCERSVGVARMIEHRKPSMLSEKWKDARVVIGVVRNAFEFMTGITMVYGHEKWT